MTDQLNDELEKKAKQKSFEKLIGLTLLGVIGAFVLIVAIVLFSPNPGAKSITTPASTEAAIEVEQNPPTEIGGEDFIPYPVTSDAAWLAIQNHFDELKNAELIDDQSDPSCKVRIGHAVTARVCTTAGQVDRVAISKRSGRETSLDTAIAAVSAIVAPEAAASDLKRVSKGAKEALAADRWTTLCPDTHCFKFFPQTDGWMIGASARDE